MSLGRFGLRILIIEVLLQWNTKKNGLHMGGVFECIFYMIYGNESKGGPALIIIRLLHCSIEISYVLLEFVIDQ